MTLKEIRKTRWYKKVTDGMPHSDMILLDEAIKSANRSGVRINAHSGLNGFWIETAGTETLIKHFFSSRAARAFCRRMGWRVVG